MLISLEPGSQKSETEQVLAWLNEGGVVGYAAYSRDIPVVCLNQELSPLAQQQMQQALPQVSNIQFIKAPYKLASREYKPENTLVRVGSGSSEIVIGGPAFVIMAGPCTIENENQLFETARFVKQAGGQILRGGAFKPRTSPYSFQGLGMEGLRLLQQVGNHFNLPVVTEVMEPGYVEAVASYADIVQIGARNMQNYPLLREVGSTGKPVLLKRGPSATLDEWLMAAEYILATGNEKVILCERGIKSFDPATRNCLDLAGAAAVQEMTHLPVIIDPSHATGKRSLVGRLAMASAAMGASGVIVECHPQPDQALCDGAQSLTGEQLREMVEGIRKVTGVLN